MLRITVLVENSDGKDLCGEHGLSLHIEYDGRQYLLDAGATELFADNAAKLGLSLADVDAAFLSHAHYDHAGGLSRFFAENHTAKVYLQEAARENCYEEKAGARKYIGIPRGLLREHADRLCFVPGAPEDPQAGAAGKDPAIVACSEQPAALGDAARDDCSAKTSVAPGIWILPHTTPNLEEQGRKAHMYRLEQDGYQIDDFAHEQSVVFETAKGLVLCNSCSHGGIVNIVKEAQRALQKEVYAVIGGFHLKGPGGVDSMAVSPEEVEEIGRQLTQLGVKRIYTGHCTGEPAFGILQKCFPEEVKRLRTGMVLSF